jgi:hypothetical protein
MMHVTGYILVFLVTSYSAIRIFWLNTTTPPSFFIVFLSISLTALIAGVIASLPKKAKLVDTFAFAIPGPATVFLLMAQGIFENKLFYLIHWLVMPLVAVGMVIFAFYLTRKIHNSKKP